LDRKLVEASVSAEGAKQGRDGAAASVFEDASAGVIAAKGASTVGDLERPPLASSGRAARAEVSTPHARICVWSVFTRIFHWSLVAAFLTSYLGNDDFTIHNTAGYVVLGLVILRVPWGFVGPSSDRFVAFVRGPSTVGRYLASLVRGRPERYLGHNPAGAVMIVALLAMLFVVTISGFLMTTDRYWGNAVVEDVHYYSSDVVLILIGFHVLGVLVSSILHRENLILAMITGRKRR
jgi:cytochrome b